LAGLLFTAVNDKSNRESRKDINIKAAQPLKQTKYQTTEVSQA